MRGRSIYWLIPAQFLAHFADEAMFGLPGWCTKHFAPLPADFWYGAMSVVAVATIVLGWAGSRRSAGPGIRLLCAGVQMLFFANALFHLITTFVFGEYSPGTASGLVLMTPISFLLWKAVRRQPGVGNVHFVTALVTGFVFHKFLLLNLLIDKGAW
jgi:hypothetical protein